MNIYQYWVSSWEPSFGIAAVGWSKSTLPVLHAPCGFSIRMRIRGPHADLRSEMRIRAQKCGFAVCMWTVRPTQERHRPILYAGYTLSNQLSRAPVRHSLIVRPISCMSAKYTLSASLIRQGRAGRRTARASSHVPRTDRNSVRNLPGNQIIGQLPYGLKYILRIPFIKAVQMLYAIPQGRIVKPLVFTENKLHLPNSLSQQGFFSCINLFMEMSKITHQSRRRQKFLT